MKFSALTTLDARVALLGERLAAARVAQGLTQVQAASAAGLSRDAVQRAESGRCTVETLLRLLVAYGLDAGLDDLLPEPGPTPVQLLAAEQGPARRRVRGSRPARPQDAPAGPPIWGDEA